MITLQFQSLDKYQISDVDESVISKLVYELADSFPKLFKEEVVADIRMNQSPHTKEKEISFVAYIPKYGKLVGSAKQQTTDQAASELKEKLLRNAKRLLAL